MSRFTLLKEAIRAVRETLQRTGVVMSKNEFKEVVLNTADDIENNIGETYRDI